jgi:hypothetical protein
MQTISPGEVKSYVLANFRWTTFGAATVSTRTRPCRSETPSNRPLARAEQHRRHVQLHLVDQTGVQVLLRGLCTARQRDVLLPRRAARLLERTLDPVGHEGERRAALRHQRLARVMRQHEHRW